MCMAPLLKCLFGLSAVGSPEGVASLHHTSLSGLQSATHSTRYGQGPHLWEDSSLPLVLTPYAGLQIVVLDKMDYCASVKNLESVIGQPNVKVSSSAAVCTLGKQATCFPLPRWLVRSCCDRFRGASNKKVTLHPCTPLCKAFV